MHRVTGFLAVLGLCTAGFGQNLLVNGDFELPPVAGSCARDTQVVTGWTNENNGSFANRNDTLYIPTCPRVAGDTAYASMQGWGNSPFPNGNYIYQTVSVTPGMTYTLVGYWAGGHMDSFGNNTLTAELRDGLDPNTGALLGQAQRIQGSGGFNWLLFSVNGTAISGQMTVVLRQKNGGATGFALHLNDVQFVQATCLQPPSITGVTVPDRATAFGVRHEVLNNVTVTGSNFTSGQTTVKLKKEGQPDITATNVVVAGDRSSLTCTLDLTGAAWGRYDVEVSVASVPPNQLNCTADTLSGGFLVVLPALSNGSFELPTAAGGCPATPVTGFPTDWQPMEIAGYGWGNVLLRNSSDSPPTCPPPDGTHYASSLSTNDGAAGGYAKIYQTIAVTPGSQYVLSGQFAGAGTNIVSIELIDGDITSTTSLGSTIVHNPGGTYDWTFASVTGTPAQPYVTAVWKVDPEGAGPHAAHADALSLQVCSSPITVTGITPSTATNTGVVNITNLAGTGFAGTPTVTLTRPGATITATDVTVVSPTQITCSFDLTGRPSGAYQVMVADGPCVGTYSSFVVMSDVFTNGSFEQGDPANKTDIPGWGLLVERTGATIEKTASGAAGTLFGGIDTTWDGQYYAGYNVGNGDGFHVGLYQVFKTLPGTTYNVSGGYFGGVGPSGVDPVTLGLEWWEVLVVDGGGVTIADMNGSGGTPTVIVKKEHLANEPSMSFRETFAGSFRAASDATTIFLKWGYSSGDYGLHLAGWDNVVVVPSCNTPFADLDWDGDVDQADFALFQICYTGSGAVLDPAAPEFCKCLDTAGTGGPDNRVDQADFEKFNACASGPGIPASGTCGD